MESLSDNTKSSFRLKAKANSKHSIGQARPRQKPNKPGREQLAQASHEKSAREGRHPTKVEVGLIMNLGGARHRMKSLLILYLMWQLL
ncbi:hypothetical protein E2C01_042394 [Portunus trituberculatus]|uniref:Uncharacterized protein n=1 Tax=Portunus trituberculatus TaxID=210409 RepID=A0A5B7FWE5_PORTR|nr:hypothetical protein [Portunus trituberculatus]